MRKLSVGSMVRTVVARVWNGGGATAKCGCKSGARRLVGTVNAAAASVGSCNVVVDGVCDGGVICYAVNTNATQSVLATVRVDWMQGVDTGSYQFVVQLPAGSKYYLGCTYGGGFPTKYNDFSIVGCQKAY